MKPPSVAGARGPAHELPGRTRGRTGTRASALNAVAGNRCCYTELDLAHGEDRFEAGR